MGPCFCGVLKGASLLQPSVALPVGSSMGGKDVSPLLLLEVWLESRAYTGEDPNRGGLGLDTQSLCFPSPLLELGANRGSLGPFGGAAHHPHGSL